MTTSDQVSVALAQAAPLVRSEVPPALRTRVSRTPMIHTREPDWVVRTEWRSVPPLQLDWTVTTRLVLIASHPDDETLGAGGLLAAAEAAGVEIDVVLLSAGEDSRPGFSGHPPIDLALLRIEETRAALALLAPSARLAVAGLPHGHLHSHSDDVEAAVLDAVGADGSRALLVAPWRRDGHADHEAAGQAAAAAAGRTGARLLEYPIWLWHWTAPTDAPWASFRTLHLGGAGRALKSHAISVHRSQVGRLSADPCDEAHLPASMLEHFVRDWETFIEESAALVARGAEHRPAAV